MLLVAMSKYNVVVERVREARRRIVAECGGDPHKIYERAKRMEEKYKDRIVTYERRKPPAQPEKP
jgi:hypothetical protein